MRGVGGTQRPSKTQRSPQTGGVFTVAPWGCPTRCPFTTPKQGGPKVQYTTPQIDSKHSDSTAAADAPYAGIMAQTSFLEKTHQIIFESYQINQSVSNSLTTKSSSPSSGDEHHFGTAKSSSPSPSPSPCPPEYAANLAQRSHPTSLRRRTSPSTPKVSSGVLLPSTSTWFRSRRHHRGTDRKH